MHIEKKTTCSVCKVGEEESSKKEEEKESRGGKDSEEETHSNNTQPHPPWRRQDGGGAVRMLHTHITHMTTWKRLQHRLHTPNMHPRVHTHRHYSWTLSCSPWRARWSAASDSGVNDDLVIHNETRSVSAFSPPLSSTRSSSSGLYTRFRVTFPPLWFSVPALSLGFFAERIWVYAWMKHRCPAATGRTRWKHAHAQWEDRQNSWNAQSDNNTNNKNK